MPEAVTISLGALIAIGLFVLNLIVLGPIGWILRQHIQNYNEHKKAVFRKLDDTEKQHSDLREHLPKEYVTNTRFEIHTKRVEDMFGQILALLNNKADK